MAATRPQNSTDPTSGSTELSILTMDVEDKIADTENMTEQPVSAKNIRPISSSTSPGTQDQPRDTAVHQGPLASAGENTAAPDIYAPQPQSFYYKAAYDNAAGQWDEYSSHANADGVDIGSPGVFNENSSLVYHAGYGYNMQMPFGPYSPVTPPLPSLSGDAQLFSPQQFPFSAQPYYQNMGPPSMPYITSPTQASQPDLTTLVSIDQQGDNMLYGPHPSYPAASGGHFNGNPATQNFHDFQHGFDGMRSGGLWSDWSKASDRQRSLPPVSPQPNGPPYGQNVGMASQHQRSFYGSGSNTYNKGYFPGAFKEGSNFGNASISGQGMNHSGWLSFDNSRRRVRGGGSFCGCNAVLDLQSEQNRGPRASRPKSQNLSEHGLCTENKDKSSTKPSDESYNQPDFVTEYRDAKFFIIKSYSEDNVHKSVKYGVWASTPNGNKKLDAAYREAKEKHESCPVFLFFSVNASAQFCGLAEMVGPVDFEKSVDYWQQDKWSGQFPLKWHIIKDVPNSQLRHIILENNDNKPVTNSRDTQEVNLEQGMEMLNIFKKYEHDTSILDDFDFYEDREKAMQEKKARQQAVTTVGVIGEIEQKNAVAPNDFVRKMSKSFAQVVRLDEGNKEGSGPDISISVPDSSAGGRVNPEDGLTAAVSSA